MARHAIHKGLLERIISPDVCPEAHLCPPVHCQCSSLFSTKGEYNRHIAIKCNCYSKRAITIEQKKVYHIWLQAITAKATLAWFCWWLLYIWYSILKSDENLDG